MKKVLSVLSCIAIVLTSGVLLAACGQTMNVRPAREVSFEGSEITYSNTASFALTSKGDGKFEAIGEASKMTAEQADEFWKGTAKEGDKYVVITVDTGASREIKYGAVEKEDDALGEVDRVAVKEMTTKEDENSVDFILRLENEARQFWRIEVKEKDAENATAYVIDFTVLYE